MVQLNVTVVFSRVTVPKVFENELPIGEVEPHSVGANRKEVSWLSSATVDNDGLSKT